MNDIETARSLTMSHMETPNLFILDPSNHFYYLPEFDPAHMTQDDLVEFLGDIKKEVVPVSFPIQKLTQITCLNSLVRLTQYNRVWKLNLLFHNTCFLQDYLEILM